VAALAMRCLQDDPKNRPAMADGVLPQLEQLVQQNQHKISSTPPMHRSGRQHKSTR
jgi:hypothetical protein